MGLDMYLTKKTYVKGHAKVSVEKLASDALVFPERITHVIEEVGYWRKASQIHGWFVDNVQNGIDNCGEYRVPLADIKKLLEACERVRDDHSLAEALLPERRGFFFGSIDYDEYYFDQINDTIEIIKEVLSENDSSEHDSYTQDYYYSSSW
jgi:hypothetical protein